MPKLVVFGPFNRFSIQLGAMLALQVYQVGNRNELLNKRFEFSSCCLLFRREFDRFKPLTELYDRMLLSTRIVHEHYMCDFFISPA